MEIKISGLQAEQRKLWSPFTAIPHSDSGGREDPRTRQGQAQGHIGGQEDPQPGQGWVHSEGQEDPRPGPGGDHSGGQEDP